MGICLVSVEDMKLKVCFTRKHQGDIKSTFPAFAKFPLKVHLHGLHKRTAQAHKLLLKSMTKCTLILATSTTHTHTHRHTDTHKHSPNKVHSIVPLVPSFVHVKTTCLHNYVQCIYLPSGLGLVPHLHLHT